MVRQFSAIGATIAMLLSTAAARAANWDEMFRLRSYGTVAVTYSDEDHADYTPNSGLQPDGVGYTDSVTAALDSKFGAQLDMIFTSRLSGVVQLISQDAFNNSWDGEGNDSFVPSLEWANLSYRVSDDLSVRIGRIVLPFHMRGDFKKVGFANHWLRAPSEVYDSLLYTTSDGADVTYQLHFGSAINTVRLHYGEQSLRTETRKNQIEAAGITNSFEVGSLTVRGAYLRAEFVAAGPGLGPLFTNFSNAARALPGGVGAVAADTADYLRPLYDPATVQTSHAYTLGGSYDPGKWFASSEVLRKEHRGYGRSWWSAYVSGGVRFGDFAPYVTYAALKTDRRDESTIGLTGLTGAARGMANSINGIVAGFSRTDRSRQTISLGIRWDFASNFAFKAQYDYIDLADGSVGDLTHIQPSFERGSSLNVAAVAIDYVF